MMHSDLISALSQPLAYSHAITQSVRVIETHISWVFLTGHFAYKVKKPVNFGFLDFSSLDKRKHFCAEELRLNQRLAPDLYLDIVAIIGPLPQLRILPLTQLQTDDHVIEYAVKMAQFDNTLRLDCLIEQAQQPPDWLHTLARQIADFHQTLTPDLSNHVWGSVDSVATVTRDNFAALSNASFNARQQQQLNRLAQWNETQLELLASRFALRKDHGKIRECHGDLHLANITLFRQTLCLFDCIEFNPALRWIDTLSDLAFLLMDIDARHQPGWSNQLLNDYLEHTGEYTDIDILTFYKTYRAMVRAKVAHLSTPYDNDALHHYIQLAASYTQAHQPILLLMHGVSGSGKSYLSQQLLAHIPAIRIRSDVERKRLYQQYQARGEKLALYGETMNTRTFHHLLTLTKHLLNLGYSVIVDATFIRQETRQHYMQLAQTRSIPVRIISCTCPLEQRKTRLIQRRNAGNDASDADVSVMQSQQHYAQPLDVVEQNHALIVNTAETTATQKVIKQLGAQGLLPISAPH